MKIIKKILPRTLFGRSLLILVTPIFLIQLVTAVVFVDRHWNKITYRLASAVAGEVVLISDEVGEAPQPDEFRRIAQSAERNLSFITHYERGRDLQTLIADNDSYSVVKARLSDVLEERLSEEFYVTIDVPHKKLEIYIQKSDGVLRILLPQSRLFSSSGYVFLLWMTGISIILLAIAILFMRNQIRPIRRLAVAADRFGKGRAIPATFKPEGAHEVRQAATAFIDMHERIRKQIQQRTAMLAGVSHDLRTPLTRMKLQVSMLPEGTDAAEMTQDIADMQRMIDSYLDFARGETEEDLEDVSVQAIVQRVTTKLDPQNKVITTVFPEMPDYIISLRPVGFERCLENVIGNARTYADKVWINVTKQEENLVIIVEDDGPGIAENMYDEVFKPFVRGEPSRNTHTGGVGLGLSIAMDIVQKHGGDIKLSESKKGGLKVSIIIPF